LFTKSTCLVISDISIFCPIWLLITQLVGSVGVLWVQLLCTQPGANTQVNPPAELVNKITVFNEITVLAETLKGLRGHQTPHPHPLG